MGQGETKAGEVIMKVEIRITADVVLNDDETVDEIKGQLTDELPDLCTAVMRISDYLINVDGELCIESEGHYEHVGPHVGD